MSLGYSANDFIQLVHFAYTVYRRSKTAGAEFVQISREVKNLHGVLKVLRNEAQQEVFKQDRRMTVELSTAAGGCTRVLLDIDNMLDAYEGLNPERGAASSTKKAWHRFKFGFKTSDLASIRTQLITHTSTISVLLDTMQLKATGRVESKIDDGFANLMGSFDHMRRVIYQIAARDRATERRGSISSLSSLSTCTGDEKEIWRQFRRELLAKGFRSCTLDEHKDVLQAYMLRLNKSGILDYQPRRLEPADETPWWARRECLHTTNFHPRAENSRNLRPPPIAGRSRGGAVDSQKPAPRVTAESPPTKSHVPERQVSRPLAAIEGQKEQVLQLETDLMKTLKALSGCTDGQREFYTRLVSITNPGGHSFLVTPEIEVEPASQLPLSTIHHAVAPPDPPDPPPEQRRPPPFAGPRLTTPQNSQPNTNQLCVIPHSPKGILKHPTARFPEHPTPIREGVKPLLNPTAHSIPPNARWTKTPSTLISPEVLTARRERYEARGDHVIILRVLTSEEVRWYAMLTRRIRGWFYPEHLTLHSS